MGDDPETPAVEVAYQLGVLFILRLRLAQCFPPPIGSLSPPHPFFYFLFVLSPPTSGLRCLISLGWRCTVVPRYRATSVAVRDSARPLPPQTPKLTIFPLSSSSFPVSSSSSHHSLGHSHLQPQLFLPLFSGEATSNSTLFTTTSSSTDNTVYFHPHQSNQRRAIVSDTLPRSFEFTQPAHSLFQENRSRAHSLS